MFFTDSQYYENIKYVEACFTLGGLSECGKTTAGIFFQKSDLNIYRMKIIQIEKEMMLDRGFDLSNGMQSYLFDKLYEHEEEALKEFTFRMIEHLKSLGYKRVSLESLYRANLGIFLKREFGNRCVNFFIDAPLEVRVRREMNKINGQDGLNISYNKMLEKVLEKDSFKIKNNALGCKEIADVVIDNGENVNEKQFLEEIYGFAKKICPIS